MRATAFQHGAHVPEPGLLPAEELPGVSLDRTSSSGFPRADGTPRRHAGLSEMSRRLGLPDAHA